MTATQHLWTIADICAATNGQTNDQAAASKTDGLITGISIDSREMKAGDLFVALPGTVSDGHKFLAAAQSAGACAALVSKIDLGWICHKFALPIVQSASSAWYGRPRPL